MKKIVALSLSILMVFGLVACGVKPNFSNADYKETLIGARAEQDNVRALVISAQQLALEEEQLSPEEVIERKEKIEREHRAVFDGVSGFVEEDMETFAISLSIMITQAYAVGIVRPAEGKTEAIVKQAEGFINAAKDNCENYLHDQYEIAKAGIVKIAPSGEVLFAMCADADKVMQNMEAALAAGK